MDAGGLYYLEELAGDEMPQFITRREEASTSWLP